MLRKTALQKAKVTEKAEELIPLMRGVVEVTVDEDGCQTVVATGFRYPEHVDFADGDYDKKGKFYPRYWGWSRTEGDLFDTYTCRSVFPLNPLPSATVLFFPKTPHDRMEELRHRAELIKLGSGVD